MLPDRFETERLTFRPFKADDAGAVLEYWRSDPSWERFNASVPENFQLADAEQFVATMCGRDRSVAPNWALVHQEVVIGVVSITLEQQDRIAVLGYGVHGDLRGRGLAMEAARAVIVQAFERCPNLQRVRAHTDAGNLPSMRVLEKLGFFREGTLRKNQYVKGRLVDEAIYGLLRGEWTGGA